MGDTGATLCAMSEQYATKYFSESIKKLKTAINANTANGSLALQKYVDLTFNIPNDSECTMEFYLIPNLGVKFLASLYLIKKLGWQFVKPNTKYTHKNEKDESFGTCNNWETKQLEEHYNHYLNYVQIYTEQWLTPYQQYINKCTQPHPIQTQLQSVHYVQNGNDNKVSFKPNIINHISNFTATKDEINKAKLLTKDKPYQPINLDYLKKKFTKNLYNKMIHLCHVKYKEVWAKHQFHTKPIPNKVFHLDLKDEVYKKQIKIYKEQYHLNEDKRLVVLYNTIMNMQNGVFEKIQHSMHNVPIIVIQRKDGRLRLAYDLTKLNTYTKDIQSHIPSYNYYFEILALKGLNTTADIKNFFENFTLYKPDRPYVTVTTPLGRFQLTRATYGFKNIATFAQQVSEELLAPFNNSAAFIDDVFIKHASDATEKELIDTADKFLARAKKMGIILHPEKTAFFVDKIAFIGYLFTQEGHHPLPNYLNKILKIPKPKTIKQIQAYLGLIQYIARYLHKYATWSKYLTDLTKKENKQKWSKVHDIAFEKLQELISKVKMLYHPTPNEPFLVQCDASKYAIGAVLYQRQYDKEVKQKQWKIIEFYSKQIDPNMVEKHPIMVKECLAIAYSLNHWKHFLLRRKFYLDTDHKNLISLYDDDETKAPEMRKKQVFQTLRQATAMFNFELAHLKGSDIILADYLSRDGSILNSIDNQEEIQNMKPNDISKKKKETKEKNKRIKLIKIGDQESNKQVNYLNAMMKHEQLRKEIFNNIKNQIWFINHNINYALIKKCVNNNFTINNLNIEYIKNHGRIIYKYSKIEDMKRNIRFDLNKYQNRHVKSIKHDPPTKEKLKHIKIKSILKKKERKNKNEKYRLSKQKKLNANLGLAIANTIRNTTKITSKDIDLYQTLIGLYTLHDGTKLEAFDKEVASSIRIIDDKIPNYNTDDQFRRRSLRKRKQTMPYWEQKVHTEGTNYPELNKNKINETDSENDDENSENEILEKQYNNQNQLHGDPNGSIIDFPFKVNANIIEEFHNRLNLPEKYQSILSPESIKQGQSCDPIAMHIINIIQNHPSKQKSIKYLKKVIPIMFNLVKSDQFQIRENILLVLPNKIFIPNKLIYSILEYEHKVNSINHPGAQVMIRQLKKKYIWPYMNKDIIEYVKQCSTCQLGKGSKSHNTGKLAPTKPTYYGHTVHCDYAGPFWNAVSILIFICATTNVVMLVLCYAQTAENIAHALIHHWIPIHGIPIKIVTDRGTGFKSIANKTIHKLLGIDSILTSAYHPQTNAKAERVVQEVKKALRMINIDLDDHFTNNKNIKNNSYVKQLIQELYAVLPSIQFAINQRINTITQISPNMLIYGRNLRDKIDTKLARETIQQVAELMDDKSHFEIVKQLQLMIELKSKQHEINHEKYRIIMKRNFDFNKQNDKFKIGDLVAYYVGDRSSTNKTIRRRFSGPWRIIERLRHNTLKIKNMDNNETLACHTSMLKKYNKNDFIPYQKIVESNREKEKLREQQIREKDLDRSNI